MASKYNALRHASLNGHYEIIKVLLKNDKNKYYINEIFVLACINGNLKIVKYLLANGADIETNNNSGLQWASHKGHFKLVKYLVDNGADINDGLGRALRWAKESGHFKIVKYLIDNGGIEFDYNSDDEDDYSDDD